MDRIVVYVGDDFVGVCSEEHGMLSYVTGDWMRPHLDGSQVVIEDHRRVSGPED